MTRMDQERAAEPELLTVGQVAEAYAVTVRTLHHYDRIGLLRPSARSLAGYRLYDPTDLTRLRDIVVYRRLGLPLEEIAAVLDNPGAAASHLTRQRALVMSRLDELRDLVDAIDHALEKEMTGQPLTTEELRELFGGEFSDGYAEDAERQWGDTPQWAQGTERTARYGREEWQTIKAENDALLQAFVAAAEAGEAPDSRAAMDAAENHRRHIETWFYDVDHDFHRHLGDLYASDPRVGATYEQARPGLAAYVRDAIRANADRQS